MSFITSNTHLNPIIFTNICHYYFDQIPWFIFGYECFAKFFKQQVLTLREKCLPRTHKENQGHKQPNHFCPCILKIYQRFVQRTKKLKTNFSSTPVGSDEDQGHLKLVRSPQLLFIFVVKAFSLVKRQHFIFHVKSISGSSCLFWSVCSLCFGLIFELGVCFGLGFLFNYTLLDCSLNIIKPCLFPILHNKHSQVLQKKESEKQEDKNKSFSKHKSYVRWCLPYTISCYFYFYQITKKSRIYGEILHSWRQTPNFGSKCLP